MQIRQLTTIAIEPHTIRLNRIYQRKISIISFILKRQKAIRINRFKQIGGINRDLEMVFFFWIAMAEGLSISIIFEAPSSRKEKFLLDDKGDKISISVFI